MKLVVRHIFLLYLLFLIVSAINTNIADISSFLSIKYFLLIIGTLVNITFLMKSREPIRKSLELYFIVFFGAVLSVNLITSTHFVTSFPRFIFSIITLLYVFTVISIDKEILQSVFRYLYWVGLVIISLSFYVLIRHPIEFTDAGNFNGVFYNANYFGSILALAILPVLVLRFSAIISNSKISKFINLSLIFCVLVLLVFSRSRGSIVSAFVFLLIFYLIKDKRITRNVVKIAFVCFFTIGTSLIFAPKVLFETIYLDYVLKYEDVTNWSQTRNSMFNDRALGIATRPAFGWGAGVKPRLQNLYVEQSKLNDTEKGNSYLALIEELGIILSVPFLLVFVGFIYLRLRATLSTTDFRERRISAILVGIIFGSLVHANVESWLFYFGSFQCVFFWLLILAHRCLDLKNGASFIGLRR